MMKFKVIKTKEAQQELDALEKESKYLVNKSFDTIKAKGIEYVHTEPLRDKLFEIKTGNIRSIYGYYKHQQIIVTVIFLKKTQKTPDKYINLAKKRLQSYIEELERYKNE